MTAAPASARPLAEEFWRAAAEGRFVLPQCEECRQFAWPPAYRCSACAGSMTWSAASGRGAIYSVTVVHRAPRSVPVPYVLAFVELVEGLRMLVAVVGEGALSAAIGDRVTADFQVAPGGDVVRPVFALERVGTEGGIADGSRD